MTLAVRSNPARTDVLIVSAQSRSQGDIWDAQKDMLADGLGAILAVILYFLRHKPKERNV
jgi:uncharacterized membrane protein YjdF